MPHPDSTDAAYAIAIEAIATGATKRETWDAVTDSVRIEQGYIREAIADALSDALRSGVEREDIDPTWF